MPGRGRGRGRRTVRMLEPALLLILRHGAAHGYTFLERLDEFGLAGLNPSVVYRALRDMEERGLVGSTWDDEETQGPPRRVYHITAEGDKALSLWARELGDARARIDHLLSLYARHRAEGKDEHN
jgi:PadR family transcriptional regulator PadR